MLDSIASRRRARSVSHFGASGVMLVLLLAAGSSACVTENLDTGEVVPRGKQRYPFEQVEEAAKRLENGMSKFQVTMLLGSPAETDENGDVWVYLPERYAILVPARALRLEFRDGVLIEHGYRPIVLGARL
jgi:outer membrane protein assembly factor BamE (lipoprotein component of BamABCDE complex)